MAVNPNGFVLLGDGGIPKTLTGKAIATLSGGFFVSAASGAAQVSSGADSFVFADIQLQQASGLNLPIGVATQNTTSGNSLAFITEGQIIVRAASAIVPGQKVIYITNNAVDVLTSGATTPTLTLERVVGRALTNAGSAAHLLIDLKL